MHVHVGILLMFEDLFYMKKQELTGKITSYIDELDIDATKCFVSVCLSILCTLYIAGIYYMDKLTCRNAGIYTLTHYL